MGTLVFHIVFVAVGAIVGAVGGWLLRGAGGTSKLTISPGEPASAPTSPQSKNEQQEPEQDFSAAQAIMARLHQLTESVAADVGEHNSRVQEISDELTASSDEAAVVTAVEHLIKYNGAMQTQLRASEERLQAQAEIIESHFKEARTDALTKLANRRAFDDEMDRCVDEFHRSGRPCCVMMIDIDNFKRINDTYGHQAGDEVLRGVARVLRRSLCGKEIVCRYGGEEFAAIFPGTNIESAKITAERARASIAEEIFAFEGLDMKVTASGGLAQLQTDETVEQVVQRSDESLYMCKTNGRNCGYWHDGTISHRITAVGEKSMPLEMEEEEPVAALDGPKTSKDGPETSKGNRRERINGVSDRDTFFSDTDRRVAEWKRGGSRLSVLFVEVDRFQHIKNEFGGKAREVVLRAAAQLLKASMRDMDHISHFDDGVFALLLPGAGMTEASAASQRIRTAIEHCKLPIDGEELTFTVSLGGAEIASGEERDELVARAQASLEAARTAGGNCSYSTTKDGDCRAMAL